MQGLDRKFLQLAIEKAKESVSCGGFPAGALIVKNKRVIGAGISMGNQLNDPTSHGEMAAIRNACASLQSTDLSGSILYTSMQPCLMCFGASIWGSVSKIVYACRQSNVSADYYGGNYDVSALNGTLMRRIHLMHAAEFESEAMNVIHAWEATIKK